MSRAGQWCTAVLLATVATQLYGAGAHVHGKATLHVAIDGGTLTLDFASPLDSLVGFEHGPRNDKQRGAVRRMAEQLHQAERLFVPTAEARCTKTAVKLESPVIPQALLAPGEPKGQSRPAVGKAEAGHAELDAEIVFKCEQPGKLASVEVNLFDAFPHLKRVDARIAAPGKQLAAELTARKRRVSW